MAASCLAVCSLNNFSSNSFSDGFPAVTLRSVDRDMFFLSRDTDLRGRLGDLELRRLSALLGDLDRLGERLGERRRGGDDRCGGVRFLGDTRLGDFLGDTGRGEERRTVLSVLTGDLVFRRGDLVRRLGDRDFLLGDPVLRRGERDRRFLGLLGLSGRLAGLDLVEAAGPFLEGDRDLVRRRRAGDRLPLSSDLMFTDIVPDPDTTRRSLDSFSGG